MIGGGESGLSLPEVALALAVMGLFASVSVPALTSALSRSRVAAAARTLASELTRLRSEAITSRRRVAMRLIKEGEAFSYAFFSDGDGDGVRAADIETGRDPLLAGPRDLASRFGGVDFGLLDVAIPQIPPRRGALLPGDDPVRFGRSDIITFTPLGTASSGTLFVSDSRSTVMAVVVYGGTGRIRTWRFDRHGWRWTK